MSAGTVDQALERAHRELFGRLVGWLFRMTGDLQLAEDAVGAAFASAVTAWRGSGIPDSPEAWLRVAARNRAMGELKRGARAIAVAPEALADLSSDSVGADEAAPDAVDDRLALMFVCAHPAIDPRMHAPLMLQTVLGVDAARIATVFLAPASTVGQRLSRAKTKIRDAGIRFRKPETPEEFAVRLSPVLQAVYAAYGLADPTADTAGERDSALRVEALRLAELLTELAPRDPETWGLLSLLLHTESRRPARIVDGEFVPLAQQDTRRWDDGLRRRADECLTRASALDRMGRFQLEAAISAVHSSRAIGGSTDWGAIALLYRGLLRVAPSIGATIGAAGALIEAGDLDGAAALLDSVPTDAARNHQPYWVCRARLATACGDRSAARAASDVAVGLTTDPVLRRFLIRTRPQ
jgi:RNA polymerase sigma-70 factor (ECF subfamily)